MAEATQHKHGYAVTLTYNDETQQSRDGAAMFQYADVMAFLARLRAAQRLLDPSGVVRFICAGEQGDLGRCHWHIVLYSAVDLVRLGKFHGLRSRRKVQILDRAHMLSDDRREVRLDWSLWGLGFVTLQELNQGSANYALSYALKDQFTAEKSHETMRARNVDNFSTGLFRPSKRPAIGERFFFSLLSELIPSNSVLPSLNIKIPALSGFYHPSGTMRRKLLLALAALNQIARWNTGRDAPQWSSLLATLSDFPTDLEVLHGPQQIEPTDWAEIADDFAARSAALARHKLYGETVRKCGRRLPCKACLAALPESELFALGVLDPEEGADRSETQNPYLGTVNPRCGLSETWESRRAFAAFGKNPSA